VVADLQPAAAVDEGDVVPVREIEAVGEVVELEPVGVGPGPGPGVPVPEPRRGDVDDRLALSRRR